MGICLLLCVGMSQVYDCTSVLNLGVKINKLDDGHLAPLEFCLLVSLVLLGTTEQTRRTLWLPPLRTRRALNITYINHCRKHMHIVQQCMLGNPSVKRVHTPVYIINFNIFLQIWVYAPAPVCRRKSNFLCHRRHFYTRKLVLPDCIYWQDISPVSDHFTNYTCDPLPAPCAYPNKHGSYSPKG